MERATKNSEFSIDRLVRLLRLKVRRPTRLGSISRTSIRFPPSSVFLSNFHYDITGNENREMLDTQLGKDGFFR